MEVEIDLDCEFGMEHIQKFRENRIREDHYNAYKSSPAQMNQGNHRVRQVWKVSWLNVLPSCLSPFPERDEGDVLTAAFASLVINEKSNVQQVKPLLSTWYDSGLAPPKAQQETRECSPDPKSFATQSAGQQSNNFINLMPSTSAQARALSMTTSITVHKPDSVRSSLSTSPLDMHAFLNQPIDAFNQMQAQSSKQRRIIIYKLIIMPTPICRSYH